MFLIFDQFNRDLPKVFAKYEKKREINIFHTSKNNIDNNYSSITALQSPHRRKIIYAETNCGHSFNTSVISRPRYKLNEMSRYYANKLLGHRDGDQGYSL